MEKTRLATAKSASKPKPMPKTELISVIVKSSVMKYPATRLFGHPAAFIKPKSRVLCAIIKKTTKDVKTAPTRKIRTPMKRMNWPKMAVRPSVSMPFADAMPRPKRLLNSKRKSDEATLNVKVMIVRLV